MKYYVEVTNSESGEPVPGAIVKVDNEDTNGGIKAEYVQTTDIDGTILFNEISESRRYIEHDLIYEVECQKDSFLVRKFPNFQHLIWKIIKHFLIHLKFNL